MLRVLIASLLRGGWRVGGEDGRGRRGELETLVRFGRGVRVGLEMSEEKECVVDGGRGMWWLG